MEDGSKSGAKTMSLEARVQRLEDEKEIRDLLVEYGCRLDARDFAGYGRLFAQDGEWLGGMGHAKGPAAIAAMLEKGFGPTPPGFKNTTNLHLLTNFLIHVDGDEASALSKIVYMVKDAEGKPTPTLAGHYDDTFVRENGSWKFRRRVVMGDIPVQDPLAPKPAKVP